MQGYARMNKPTREEKVKEKGDGEKRRVRRENEGGNEGMRRRGGEREKRKGKRVVEGEKKERRAMPSMSISVSKKKIRSNYLENQLPGYS